MDQHAIPQNVTGFQFKLVGNMTVKQFGYVAAGVISATVLYYLPLHFPLAFMVKLLLIPLLGSSGFIVAFAPIDGRPVDVMAGNFFKAFFSPNQYIYHKTGRTFSFSAIAPAKTQTKTQVSQKTVIGQKSRQINKKELQLQALLQTSAAEVKNDLDKKELSFLQSITKATTPEAQSAQTQVQQPYPFTTTALPTQPAPVSQPAPLAPAGLTPPATQPINPSQPIQPTAIAQATNLPLQQPNATSPVPPSVPSPLNQQQPPTTQSASQPTPQPQKLEETNTTPEESLNRQETMVEQQLASAKQEEKNQQTTQGVSSAHQRVLQLEQQLQTIHAQKMQLEEEILRLKKQLSPKGQQESQPASAQTGKADMQPSTPIQTPQVKKMPLPTKNTTLPRISDTPNIIVGIVKDPRGNILPNILVEVKDKDGNPVRAFKTNALGQFASATPLASGIYTIDLEDPKRQQFFDTIQVVANNKILMPLEIISQDAREQLRKELFN